MDSRRHRRRPNPRRGSALGLAMIACGLWACEPSADTTADRDLESEIRAVIDESGAGVVGLYYRTLGPRPDSLVIDGDARMHAASTMKVPVMMQLFLDAQEGVRSLDAELPITRTFASIVDGSTFELPPESDSDTTFYGQIGQTATVRHMIDRMITWSSNLATNILIQKAEPERINTMLDRLGASEMHVLRGVEDLKAFEAGLSNTTTARALGAVMVAVAQSDLFTADSRSAMIEILERQHFRDAIPAGLPEGTRVANKTGWVTGVQHDAAIVYPETAESYVLVISVLGHPAEDQGEAMTAELSRLVWDHHVRPPTLP